jgi:diguanylate cyclase (GGDEF)-like protein
LAEAPSGGDARFLIHSFRARLRKSLKFDRLTKPKRKAGTVWGLSGDLEIPALANALAKTPFPRAGKIVRLVVMGTACCILLSLMGGYLLLLSGGFTPFQQNVVLAIVVPALIAAPLLAIIGYRGEQIGHLRRELTRQTTYDSLTSCLRASVFSSLVDRRKALPPGEERRGAFMIIHAGGLRSIQRNHGFARGSETLRFVGEAIRGSVRETDMVGRMNAADFGVFLPGATEEDARNAGKRILERISANWFLPGDADQTLTVRVAGVVFKDELLFDDMFRAAQDLFDERPGSNVVLSHWPRRPHEAVWTN